MNPLERLTDIDPFAHLQSGEVLPPQPSCASLSDVLALVDSRLGTVLLDATGRAALHRVADRISVHLSTFWGLEIRLGDPAPRADFLWEVRQDGGGVRTLAGRNRYDPSAEATGALRERSVFWREMARFAQEWLDKPDWLRRLGGIWLEADLAAADASLDTLLDRPSLFWGPNHAVSGADRELLGQVATLGHRFYGLALDQSRIDALANTIPEQGEVFQVGVMGARASPTIRLCVKGLDIGTTQRWLAAIGWPGDQAHLHGILVRLEPLCGQVALNVDILPGRVGPQLGLELYGARRTLSMEDWQPLHDELVARGLARADKVAALQDYPLYQQYRQMATSLRAPHLGFPVLVTNLHHLKLVIVGGAAVEAKAYLSVFFPVMNYSSILGHETQAGGDWLP